MPGYEAPPVAPDGSRALDHGAGRLRAWHALAPLAVLAIVAAVLLAMGRVPVCTCGTIKLWYGHANGPETSQHLLDPYTPTHVLHGFLLYAGLWSIGRLRGRSIGIGWALLVATLIEGAWEVVENSPVVVERYRTATMALHYEGDSIVNSMTDILAAIAGFLLASRLPVAATVALAIGVEVVLAYLVRDNLALNVLMLLYPVESIRAWQAGA